MACAGRGARYASAGAGGGVFAGGRVIKRMIPRRATAQNQGLLIVNAGISY